MTTATASATAASHFAHFTDNMLLTNTICFESVPLDKTLVPIPDHQEDMLFGILHFVARTTALTDNILDFVFNIDCSASMSTANATGRRSKMQHIIHTLSNMIAYFKETPELNVHITIIAFNEMIYHVVDRTKVTEDNYSDIITKIQAIQPNGGTNIELALKSAASIINDIHLSSSYSLPEHLINHIFMTDGNATSGFHTAYMLQQFIVPTHYPEKNVQNYVIGFGVDHDATLLAELSLLHNCHYYFVDTLESAGLVYGEILHTIMRRLLRDATITVSDGLIYNYATNAWTTQLSIGDVASETIKTFNIVSANPDLCRITINSEIVPRLIMSYPATRIDDALLPVHLFRQRTLQLLYEAVHYNQPRYSPPPSYLTPALIPTRYMDDDVEEENADDANGTTSIATRLNSPMPILQQPHTSPATRKQQVFDQLCELMFELKAYMMNNTLDDKDKAIIKHLHADLFVCYQTFNHDYGNMYCHARLTSQGCQRQYCATANHITPPATASATASATANHIHPHPLVTATCRLDDIDANSDTNSDTNSDYKYEDINDDDEADDDNDWDQGEIILLGTPCLNLEVLSITPYITPQAMCLMARLNK